MSEPESQSPTDSTRENRSRLPSWFLAVLCAAVVWCAAAGIAGIALLVAGCYQAAVVGGIATFAGIAAGVVTTRGLGPRRQVDHVAPLVAVALCLAFFAFAAALHSEHLLRDRDPAVYITTGRTIARTHRLRPKIAVGPFKDPVFGNPNARYRPDFFPMLPVLLALGWSVGGDTGLLLVGPVLGALGLLAIYAFASHVVGTRVALFVPALLAVVPLQLWFARDAYSELVVQVLVFGGLWMFLEARACASRRAALIAGCVVASAALARVDALAIFAGAFMFLGVEWARCDSDPVPMRARQTVATFAGALFVATVVSIVTTHHVATRYVTSLDAQYRELLVAFFLSGVAVGGAVVVHRVRPGLGRRIASRSDLFVAAVVAGTAVFVWSYLWRPDPARDFPVVAPGQSASPAVRNAMFDWHFSRSVHWFSAYFGVVGIGAAFVGFVILAVRARRGGRAASLLFLVAIPVTVLYLARPSITPDQPWAMRRYLPVVIPGIAVAVIVAFVTAVRAAERARRNSTRTLGRLLTAAAGVVVVVGTVRVAIPFATARMQRGAEAAIHRVCAEAGDAAVLVYSGNTLDIELPDVLRAFCGMPVGTSDSASDAVDLHQLALQWHASGRRLLVAAPATRIVTSRVPAAVLVGHFLIADEDEPERVFDQAPGRHRARPFEFWLYEIPTAVK